MATTAMTDIENRIRDEEAGTIFMTGDFSDITSLTTARKCLGRLVDKGLIRRVMDGVYEKPKYSSFLKEYVPTSPEKVAYSIARNYHWSIAPCGDVALNKLGLSTQIPTVWSYISDGPYREFSYDGTKLAFKHRTNRDVSQMSELTIMVIEALKTIGKDRVTEKTVQTLSQRLPDSEKALILKEASDSAEWIYEVIRKVCS